MSLIEQDLSKLTAHCGTKKGKELYVLGSVFADKFNDTCDNARLIQFNQVGQLEYSGNY